MSPHVIKAMNVHMGRTKEKIFIYLYSLKTHSEANHAQSIKISSKYHDAIAQIKNCKRHFCPFDIVYKYIHTRDIPISYDDPFFVFRSGIPVQPRHIQNLLKILLKRLGLNPNFYGVHSLRIGRTTDLIKLKYDLELVKRIGHWKSGMVYRYIH